MAQQRYDIRKEDGTWTVFDVFTGLPAYAQPGGLDGPAFGLDMEEADDLVDLLNEADRRRRNQKSLE